MDEIFNKKYVLFSISQGINKWHAGYNELIIKMIYSALEMLPFFLLSTIIIELHGSLWRLRCLKEGRIIEDRGKKYKSKKCDCGVWLRPDIVWFGDNLDRSMVDQAYDVSGNADLFISIGTSGEVWPAAGIPQIARENNARMIEINPEETEASQLYDDKIRKPSSIALTELFDEY